MPVTWIDPHCHIHDQRIVGGAAAAVERARERGVTTMITVGCDEATTLAAIAVAEQFDNVWASAGLHPHDAVNGTATIVPLLDHPKVVAVGECGLDYYYDHSPRDVQRRVFAEHIALANERDMPLIIHSRDAWDETFEILEEHGTPRRTVFHCFTGNVEQAQRCLELGAYLSFSGIVTFKTALDLQEAARICPLERMMVETDSPYLAPLPYRGKPNEPGYVPLVGAFIAELRGVPVEAVAEATTAAARLVFPGIAP